MARTDRNHTVTDPFAFISAIGEAAPSKEQKLCVLRGIRESGAPAANAMDEFLVDQVTDLRTGLQTAQSVIEELRAVVDKYQSPPLIPARFLRRHPSKPLVEVMVGSNRMIVTGDEDLDLSTLRSGDEVVLNQKLGTVMGVSPFPPPAHGDTATFQRLLVDGRMVVRTRDEEIVIGVVAAAGHQWRFGDTVRYDPAARLAMEKIPHDDTNEFRLQALPDLPLGMVGGHQACFGKLISAMTLAVLDPDVAQRFDLSNLLRFIGLFGPPGCGKTLMLRVAGSHLQRLSGRKCYLNVVKPGQFEDPYVGVTQRRIRNTFECMRAQDGISLLFIDEIESIGRARGGLSNGHGDKFLGALLVELQGMESSSDHPIVVVAASNRPDMLDPALLSRMELQLQVGRPDARAFREIVNIHLPETLPYRSNGHSGDIERQRMIDRAVSLFYSPNGSTPLATVKLRDGTQRTIMPAELVSGRCVDQFCRAAKQTVAFRKVEGGDATMTVEDIEEAIVEAQANLASSLTRYNIHNYLSDLRQDMEVVAVERTVRHAIRPYRFLKPAAE